MRCLRPANSPCPANAFTARFEECASGSPAGTTAAPARCARVATMPRPFVAVCTTSTPSAAVRSSLFSLSSGNAMTAATDFGAAARPTPRIWHTPRITRCRGDHSECVGPLIRVVRAVWAKLLFSYLAFSETLACGHRKLRLVRHYGSQTCGEALRQTIATCAANARHRPLRYPLCLKRLSCLALATWPRARSRSWRRPTKR